jgi:hypothetical protein
MDPTDDVAREVVECITGLLEKESGLTWTYGKADNVWRLAPAGSAPPGARTEEDLPQHRAQRAAPGSGSASEAFDVCIVDCDFSKAFLLYVAQVVYQEFGLLTNLLSDEDLTPDAAKAEARADEPQTPNVPVDPDGGRDLKAECSDVSCLWGSGSTNAIDLPANLGAVAPPLDA